MEKAKYTIITEHEGEVVSTKKAIKTAGAAQAEFICAKNTAFANATKRIRLYEGSLLLREWAKEA